MVNCEFASYCLCGQRGVYVKGTEIGTCSGQLARKEEEMTGERGGRTA